MKNRGERAVDRKLRKAPGRSKPASQEQSMMSIRGVCDGGLIQLDGRHQAMELFDWVRVAKKTAFNCLSSDSPFTTGSGGT